MDHMYKLSLKYKIIKLLLILIKLSKDQMVLWLQEVI
jgi:hypothetical protein